MTSPSRRLGYSNNQLKGVNKFKDSLRMVSESLKLFLHMGVTFSRGSLLRDTVFEVEQTDQYLPKLSLKGCH